MEKNCELHAVQKDRHRKEQLPLSVNKSPTISIQQINWLITNSHSFIEGNFYNQTCASRILLSDNP